MKKATLFLVILLITAGFTLNRGSTFAAETSGSASVDFMSSYMWRGFQLHEDEAIQPSVGITYGGFGANLWADFDTGEGELFETDLTLNYTFSVEKFSFDVGYIYYGLDSVPDTQEFYVSVGYDILLNPSLTVYYDFDEGDGAFITASIGHDFTFEKGISLALGASVSYNAESEYAIGDYSDFHNADLSASLTIPIIDDISISPMIAYSFDLSDDAETAIEGLSADGDDSAFLYGGVNISLSF